MKNKQELTAEQAEYWNGPGGKMWLGAYDRIQRGIAGFSDVVLAAARAQPGEHVLDVGCGTGGTTAELAKAVGERGHVLGVDISEPLIGAARAQHLANATFEVGDAATYSFGANVFDLVFSRFGVMFFADPVAAFTNLRRALAPRGRLAFACWQQLDRNPWMMVPMGAAAKHVPLPPPPPPGAPGPGSLADPERVARILDQAGFRDVSLEALETKVRVAGGGGVEAATRFLLEGVGPTSQAMREASASAMEAVTRAVQTALEPYLTPRGVELGASVWIVTARGA